MSDVDHCDECNVEMSFTDLNKCTSCDMTVCAGCWDFFSKCANPVATTSEKTQRKTMTDHDKLLALFKELGERVEWEFETATFRLIRDGSCWMRFYCYDEGCGSEDIYYTDHEAFCIMQDELLRWLREKWDEVGILYQHEQVTIEVRMTHRRASEYTGLNLRYQGPSALDAYLAAAKEEL